MVCRSLGGAAARASRKLVGSVDLTFSTQCALSEPNVVTGITFMVEALARSSSWCRAFPNVIRVSS
jgi:hypothetical protein